LYRLADGLRLSRLLLMVRCWSFGAGFRGWVSGLIVLRGDRVALLGSLLVVLCGDRVALLVSLF